MQLWALILAITGLTLWVGAYLNGEQLLILLCDRF